MIYTTSGLFSFEIFIIIIRLYKIIFKISIKNNSVQKALSNGADKNCFKLLFHWLTVIYRRI